MFIAIGPAHFHVRHENLSLAKYFPLYCSSVRIVPVDCFAMFVHTG